MGGKMNGVEDVFLKSMRLAILRYLEEGAEYELNTSVLHSALDATGLNASRDKVEGECAWLEEQGLVVVERLENPRVVVVRLTPRGKDVSRGMARHPGVDRPNPRWM
jgi:DNA-binding MarR family transcriptional regulator